MMKQKKQRTKREKKIRKYAQMKKRILMDFFLFKDLTFEQKTSRHPAYLDVKLILSSTALDKKM